MRLIDADKITGAKFHDLPYTHIVPRDVESEFYILGWNDAIDAIVEVEPTIDAVEVVRCKECKYKYLDGMIWKCPFGLFGGENFFCGYGSKDGEEE